MCGEKQSLIKVVYLPCLLPRSCEMYPGVVCWLIKVLYEGESRQCRTVCQAANMRAGEKQFSATPKTFDPGETTPVIVS